MTGILDVCYPFLGIHDHDSGHTMTRGQELRKTGTRGVIFREKMHKPFTALLDLHIARQVARKPTSDQNGTDLTYFSPAVRTLFHQHEFALC
jgi:hypothetical protein